MSKWQPTSLGEIVDVIHGFAFKGEQIVDEPTNGILVTPGNFAVGGGFKSEKLKYFAGPAPNEYVLSVGDLIVTMTDLSRETDTLGYAALVPKREDGRQFLHNQRIGKVVLKPGADINLRWLQYLMRSKPYRDEIVASATGTTVKHTSPSRILRFRFSKPSREEQDAIAAVLGALDDKIELNRRMSQTLEAMAQAIFKAWFVDFDHAWPLDDWEQKPLDDVAEFMNGLALQMYPAIEGEDSLPVIKIAQLRAGHTKTADRAGTNVPEPYVINDGDLLFSWSGSLEVCARRPNFDHPCRLNIDQGWKPVSIEASCG